MAQGPEQFPAADGIGQVIFAAVRAMEQHQRAAIVEDLQFTFVQRSSLVDAIAVALLQFGQAGSWQATQLFLRAQLHGQYGACLGLASQGDRRDRAWNRRVTGVFAQIGEWIFAVIIHVGFGAVMALHSFH
ncbi:hypothetical protein D3C76_1068200 [compost metagenome]